MLFPLIVSLPVLFCFQGGTVLFKMPNTLTIAAPHLIAVVPGCLHSDATACYRLVIDKTRKVVNVHGMYHVSDVVQSKVPLLVADYSHPLVSGRKSLENNVLVLLIVHCLPHFLESITAFVHDKNEIIGILAGLHFRVDQLLVASPSSLLFMTVIFFI